MMRCKSIFVPVVFCMVIFTSLSCGKKGMPFLPGSEINSVLSDFKVQLMKGGAELSGMIKLAGKEKLSDVKGYRVYHAYYDFSHLPCEKCPINMHEMKPGYCLIPVACMLEGAGQTLTGDVFSSERFSCQIPVIKEKGRHYFEVRLMGANDIPGPPSDKALLEIH